MREWRWPRAGRIKFSHLQFDSTLYAWQGAQIDSSREILHPQISRPFSRVFALAGDIRPERVIAAAASSVGSRAAFEAMNRASDEPGHRAASLAPCDPP